VIWKFNRLRSNFATWLRQKIPKSIIYPCSWQQSKKLEILCDVFFKKQYFLSRHSRISINIHMKIASIFLLRTKSWGGWRKKQPESQKLSTVTQFPKSKTLSIWLFLKMRSRQLSKKNQRTGSKLQRSR